MGSPSEPAVPAYRRLRIPRKHPQVLGGDLNCSESMRRTACPRLSLPPPTLSERCPSQGFARRGIAVRQGVGLRSNVITGVNDPRRDLARSIGVCRLPLVARSGG